MGAGQIVKYARGELTPRVLRAKNAGTPPLMLRVHLSEPQQAKLAELARALRQSVPQFVGGLLRARLEQGGGGSGGSGQGGGS